MIEDVLTLELLFENALGTSKKITVRNPKEGLTEAEVRNTIDTIASTEIFSGKNGDPYAIGKGARYVSRRVNEIYSEE
ncbi:DUF2922 domain-containing protein [Aerococcus urinaeequi]|uniref:DUF2922 domain-containing protein n=1 Tax=Aerococcus urinaeequi TaxID=51665 RepID=UPI000845C616|nr:DUF2922 domain-containing protein [Aerococcus urinaeequi]